MAPDDAYMRDSDAFSWYMEADPLLRSTIVSVVVLDQPPDLDLLFDRIERATRVSPGFRHRVVQAPWRMANPRWAVDPEFNLGFHTRHIGVPAPGTLAQVFDYACKTGMAGFDRDRPLWEFTLVDGLEGGRTALILKLHHALTDGIGGMEMAKYLFDLEPEPGAIGPMPDAPDPEQLSAIDLARDALCHNVSRIAHAPRDLLGTSRALVRRTVRHPATAVENGWKLVRSVARTVQPVSSTLSPIMTDRRLAWHYDAFTVPLDALRRAARATGLTLNDVFLGAISGGLLRYHERRGFPVDELRLTMPISIRTADDPIGGNRITLMRFKVPTGVHDPVDRMRQIHELCLSAAPRSRDPAHEHDRGRAQRSSAWRRRRHAQARRLPREQRAGNRRARLPRRRARRRVVRVRSDDRVGVERDARVVRRFLLRRGERRHRRDSRRRSDDRVPARELRRNRVDDRTSTLGLGACDALSLRNYEAREGVVTAGGSEVAR